MPQFSYRGRDREGQLRVGQRSADTANNLSTELIKEGITPIQIKQMGSQHSYWDKLRYSMQSESLHREELTVFTRQMQVLHQAGVPIMIALKQLIQHTRSHRLQHALQGMIEHFEKGESLATAMHYYPETFSPLMINIVQIGENTGKLSEAFAQLHRYLEFESSNIKQIKSAFRYPLFVLIAIIFAVVILNIFVIPTFARFYINLEVTLPWQTRFLIGMSNFFVNYGLYLLVFIILACILLSRYLRTPQGRYVWDKSKLSLPIIGKLLRRIILIRFSQSFAIILNAGLPVTQGLTLIKNIMLNAYIIEQVARAQEAIERGISFTQAMAKIDLFTSLEVQILAVGEKSGELASSLSYIADFHSHEIEFDLKRMNDFLGPILIGAAGGLILIIALGIYLPIWNMVNLTRG